METENKLSVEEKVVLQWTFKMPEPQEIPSAIGFHQLLAHFNPGKPTPTTAVIMRLSLAYFEKGCPVELCDYAACRDLWNEIQKQKRPNLI